MRGSLLNRRVLALASAGAVLLLLVLAQLLLPRLAAARIRSRIGRYGRVASVSVSAWPAIKLLWGSVDSVSVSAGALTLSEQEASSLLWEARNTANLHFSAQSVRIGRLAVSDATLVKRAKELTAQALASEADVRAALPAGVGVSLLRSDGGQVEVSVGGSLFGLGASIDAVALPSEGRLVVKPVGFLLGALQLTLLSDAHVYVRGVGASKQSADPLTYRLSLSASLR